MARALQLVVGVVALAVAAGSAGAGEGGGARNGKLAFTVIRSQSAVYSMSVTGARQRRSSTTRV